VIELYRIRELYIKQNFWNRFTNDGSLVAKYDEADGRGVLELVGFFPFDELRLRLDGLRNVVVLLRSGPWGAGIRY